ncbi:MAG: hypothetical protein M3M86_07475 [Thermoproteota archaeon]|nr:hypothetical protein [Thermoproteota archaeon]
MLKLKQEALRLIILDGFGNLFNNNKSPSSSSSCTDGNRSSLYCIILILREKEGEREYSEADDNVVIRVIIASSTQILELYNLITSVG